MVLFPLVLFAVLVGWGLYDTDIYLQEAGIFAGILAVAAVCVLLIHLPVMVLVVVTILLDIVLIVKVLGGDTQAF